MNALVLFILSSIGLTHIVVDGSIFQPIRDVLKKILPTKVYTVFECYQCAGTWCGLICGAMLFEVTVWNLLVSAFAGSFLSTWSITYLNYLEARTLIDINEKDD